MRHIRNRDDALDLLQSCPLAVVRRLADEDNVEVLGLFKDGTPGRKGPAWMFIVTGKKKEWIISITPHHQGATYAHMLEVPWPKWVGIRTGVASGDNTFKYAMNRAAALKEDDDGLSLC